MGAIAIVILLARGGAVIMLGDIPYARALQGVLLHR